MSMIDVKGLNFAFGSGELGRQVLIDIHLSIDVGEIVILTGPSGSGKTTLLTILGGLRLATSGSVVVLGEQLVRSEASTRIAVRRQTGYIFQQHNLFLSLTATENVCMALEAARRFL